MSTYISENTIEEFTIKLLAHNGYEYNYTPNIAHDGETPERTSYEEVLLLDRLRESIRRINPTIPPEIQEQKAKAKWTQLEALIGSENRIKNIANDIILHFGQRQEIFEGKGMIVTMSRRIAADLYEELN